MVFWEHKPELLCFLLIPEETEVIVNSKEDDVKEAQD